MGALCFRAKLTSYKGTAGRTLILPRQLLSACSIPELPCTHQPFQDLRACRGRIAIHAICAHSIQLNGQFGLFRNQYSFFKLFLTFFFFFFGNVSFGSHAPN